MGAHGNPNDSRIFSVTKKVDETIQSDNTSSDDAELFMLLPVGYYRIWGSIKCISDATADFKSIMTLPTNAKGQYSGSGISPANGGASEWTDAEVQVISNTVDKIFYYSGFLNVPQEGLFVFKWSQVTITAINTSVMAGSYFSFERLHDSIPAVI